MNIYSTFYHMMNILHAAPGGFPSHVSTGQLPYHSFVMPIQGVVASYANGMGLCPYVEQTWYSVLFEILQISQHSVNTSVQYFLFQGDD
ncbi:hypothetical protein V7128_21635 [Neobacillus vireti]